MILEKISPADKAAMLVIQTHGRMSKGAWLPKEARMAARVEGMS